MPGRAEGLFLLAAFRAADLVDRPSAIGMLLQPANRGKQSSLALLPHFDLSHPR